MSGSYEKGGQPRSVADPDDAPYRTMIVEHKAQQQRKDERSDYWSEHPGLGESIVPVWGSAREAIADYREGDLVGATVNGALALSDLAPGGFAVKGALKGAVKLGGSHTWNATRKFMGKKGLLESGQHGHHGMIPRGGWGAVVPDAIKNQPWNITAMPSAEVHGRIHGRYGGKPQFNPVERYFRGSPNWAKAAHGWIPTRAVTTIDAQGENRGDGIP